MPTFNKQLTVRLLHFAVRLTKVIDAFIRALVVLDEYGCHTPLPFNTKYFGHVPPRLVNVLRS